MSHLAQPVFTYPGDVQFSTAFTSSSRRSSREVAFYSFTFNITEFLSRPLLSLTSAKTCSMFCLDSSSLSHAAYLEPSSCRWWSHSSFSSPAPCCFKAEMSPHPHGIINLSTTELRQLVRGVSIRPRNALVYFWTAELQALWLSLTYAMAATFELKWSTVSLEPPVSHPRRPLQLVTQRSVLMLFKHSVPLQITPLSARN